MSKIVKVVKVLRNNWKKTVVGTVALVYGVKYGIRSYESTQMMRAYCEAAKLYGQVPIPVDTRPRHVTVILNPAANKRKAKKEFEQYCAPLLHLAGLSVNLIVTGKEGQARSLTEKLEEATDAIIIAGGDGTLSEAVTGILRREDGFKVARTIPLGVVPLGKTNSIAKQLFPDSAQDRVKLLADATMAVIEEATKSMDVIKFQVIPTDGQDTGKPVYGLVGMQWGAFRDAQARREKYWYFGGLRGYATYLFTGLKGEKDGITWRVEAKMQYSPPCEGCSLCFSKRIDLQPDRNQNKSWWSVFGARQPGPTKPLVDYRQIVNEECEKTQDLNLVTTDFSLLSSNMSQDKTVSQLLVSYGSEELSFQDYVLEGWRRESGERPSICNSVVAKEVKLWPAVISGSSEQSNAKADNLNESSASTKKQEVERWVSIDNEDYEVKAIDISLLPNAVKLFCSSHVNRN